MGNGLPRPRHHHDHRLPIDPDLAPDDPAEPSATHHRVPHVRRGRQHAVITAIGAGGFLGSLGRYELALAWPARSAGLPWSTFAVNASGSFLLGLVLTMVLERRGPEHLARSFFCVGVLGAWTTMSTFAVETDLLLRDGHPGVAAAYVAGTVGAGLALAWLGITLARVLDPERMRWASP